MFRSLSLIAVLFYCHSSLAYFSFLNTGEIKDKGEYRVLGESQVLFDSPNGMNLNGRFDLGVTEDSEVQLEMGVGGVDYSVGASWKWVPFPDTHDQPAIGLRTGLTFADLNGYSTYGVTVAPFVSKNFESNAGGFAPYAALQLGFLKNTFDTMSTSQLIVGIEWTPNSYDMPKLEGFRLLTEFGIEIDKPYDYLSIAASYNF